MRALLHCRPFRRLFVQSGSLRLWNLLIGLTARPSQPSNVPACVDNCSIFETCPFVLFQPNDSFNLLKWIQSTATS